MVKTKTRLTGPRSLIVCFLLVSFVFLIFQPQLVAQQTQNSEDKENTETRNKDNPKRLKSKEIWEHIIDIPGIILYTPIWLLYNLMIPISTIIQKNAALIRIVDFLKADDGSRAAFPYYVSRIGAGVGFYQKNLIAPGSKLDISAAVGLRWRQAYHIRFSRVSLGGPFISEGSVHYSYYTDEPFFGIGNDSLKDTETNFAHRQTAAEAALGLDLGRNLMLTSRFGFERHIILEGKASSTGSTTDLPLQEKSFIPGLAESLDLFSLKFRLEYDSRNWMGNPSAGWYLSMEGGFFKETGDDEFGFWKIHTDITRYIHLFYDRSFVVRVVAKTTRPYKDQKIPFYYLSQLGTRDTIRGFSRGRFRGRDMALATVEYRFPLIKRPVRNSLDGVFFLDAGRVFHNIFNDFTTRDFHYGYGGGIRFFTKNGVIFQLILGRSQEGFRLYLTLNE